MNMIKKFGVSLIIIFILVVVVLSLWVLCYLNIMKLNIKFLDINGGNANITRENKKSYKVCLTAACVKAAAQLITNIDPDIDPCDDFYDFACGNWIKNTIIPEHRLQIESIDD